MTEDTHNVRDAFASVDTSRARLDTDIDGGDILDWPRAVRLIRELRDENTILRGSLELYTHASPAPSAQFQAFALGAVTTLISCAVIVALALFIRREL